MSRTCLIFIREQEQANKYLRDKQVNVPMIFVIANKDKVVSNQTIDHFAKINNNPRGKVINFEEADHSTITIDEEISKSMCDQII